MKSQAQPKIIKEIEALWGQEFELHQAPEYPDILAGLMAIKKDRPKYAVNEAGILIGLNLAETGLDDTKWQRVIELLEANKIHLQALNLSNNELQQLVLPAGLDILEKFEVNENSLERPPKQVVEQGDAAILNFFKQIEKQEGTVPLYEAKLLIVGEPGAGKTTLQKKLIDPDYIVPPKGDERIKSTIGVNIHEGWEFPYITDKGIQFNANLWDFGGQEIQYMTHHFFLTPRALYVLVADDRKQNTEFDYWFRIINLLGRENDEEKISLLVLLNEINHVSISNFDLGKYRKDYPNIDVQLWEVDFSVKDIRSENISQKIQEMICKLPQIGDLLPRLWIPIREDLFKMREEKPHIKFSEFAAICSKERDGKSLTEERDQRFLSQYLHRLGVMLHYQEDDFLDNFVILNPQWAVDAVYSVLKDSRVVKNQGRFTALDLKEFWKKYSADERSRLLTLMLKDRFEICYESQRQNEYIAPQLLPTKRPLFEWDSANAMKFRYQYPFMPKGLISRLIVRLSDEIAKGGELVWNEGVVIERNGCQAQIIQEKTVKEGLEVLEIELCGSEHERKYLLRHIMNEVEKIHEKSFKHIDFERMFPCICEDCKGTEQPTFFKYSQLVQYHEAGEGWEKIDCGKDKLKKVPVKALLEGVFEKTEGRVGSKAFHFHIYDPEMREDVKSIKQGVNHLKEDNINLLLNQELQLVYAERHRTDIETLLFTRIETVEAVGDDLQRINAYLEMQLDQYFTQLPVASEIAQKWNETKNRLPDQANETWSLKLKIPFIFGEFEKDITSETKATLNHIREDITAFIKGEINFKQLFIKES